ncbi:MAG: hypothetical protein AB8B85_08395 [Paracoccaceae bacterium]
MVERASPFAADVSGSAVGVTMEIAPRGSLWQVAAWPESFDAIEKALASACGCKAPKPGRAVETKAGGLLIRTEPLKWWVMGADAADCPLRPDSDQGASLDMSHDQAGVMLIGEAAAEICKRMLSLDLRELAFPDLTFASTHMHHMITKVLRHDRGGVPAYQVMVMRAYADDLRALAAHHLEHFG